MQNEMAEAFSELAAANREVLGEPDIVLLRGRHVPDAIAEEITTDEVVMAGGNGDTGGGRVMIPMIAVADQPQRRDDIMVNGRTWDVLSVIERNRATYELTYGEIVVEDA